MAAGVNGAPSAPSAASGPRSRLRRLRPIAVLIGGFALFSLLSGGPPPPDPQAPAASAAPTPWNAAESAQATERLVRVVVAAGLGPMTSGGDVRPPLPVAYLDLPRVVVRGASSLDPVGPALIGVLFSDAGSAAVAAPEIAAYLTRPQSLVLVPPDARFTLRLEGSLLVIFQRSASNDPDPESVAALVAALEAVGVEVPLPR